MHRYEKIWLIASSAMILGFMLIIGYQAFALDMGPPSDQETLDPQQVESTPPFDNPGVEQIGENEYEVVMTLQTFSFDPMDLEFPAGSTVHFVMTSKDVVHGIQVAGTNLNTMVVPGYVTRITETFDEPGEYLAVCNEYCGAGHQFMAIEIKIK